MGEYGGCNGDSNNEKVKHVVDEDRSRMRGTLIEDDVVNATEEGHYVNGNTLEVDYSAYSSENQQVGRKGATSADYGHRRVRSASEGHSFLLFKDEVATSKSNEKDECAKENTRPMTQTKGISLQYEHLQQPSLDAHSDPGYGDNHETIDLISKLERDIRPRTMRSHSIDRVSGWLRDACIGKNSEGFEIPHQDHGQPSGRTSPRRTSSGNHGVAVPCASPHSSPQANPKDIFDNHYDTNTVESQSNDKTPHEPSRYQHSPDAHDYEESQLAIHDQPSSLSPGSIYRGPGDQRPLSNKAFDFVKKGAVGFAIVSQKAAVEIAKVSRTTSKQVRNKSIELKNLAAPVLAPIFQAVVEEGRDQSMGPPDRGHERVYDQREVPNSAELERMATPYVQPIVRGKGIATTSQKPLQQQSTQGMRPTMQGGRSLVMRPMAGGQTGSMPTIQYVVPPMGVSARPSGIPAPRPHVFAQHPARSTSLIQAAGSHHVA